MERLIKSLRTFDALRDNIEEVEKRDTVLLRNIPNEMPMYAPDNVFDGFHPSIQKALKNSGIIRLYEHQADAIKHSLNGENVVLESPTASGKTLSFCIPLFDCLLKDSNAHALMIYPMKAVSNDQRRQIQELANHIHTQQIESWTYDGDTDEEHRKILREHPPSILITNPEMLHLSFLWWSQQWIKFYQNLKYIVIDEIHEYRGYFGTNVSLLLRRFLLMLQRMGNNPKLFLSTATCANPLEHAEHLTGRKFTLVSAKNKMKPYRKFAFINPRIPNFKFLDIYRFRIARAALACISEDLSTLVFCPSRKFTEDVFRCAKREAEKYKIDICKIAPYRSGYTPDQRREIEDGLRTGKYKVVFTTNALELGIDIGRLDVCILAGFPDSVMSAWQRIGRTGRSFEKTAYVLYYAMNNAFDQFYAENIDAFIQKPLDEIAIGLDNEELIGRHIPYLLHETSWQLSQKDKDALGDAFYRKAKEKASSAKPLAGGVGPHYMALDIRGGAGSVLTLKYKDKDIGSISDVQQFREAYIGGIYNHCGKEYKVAGLTSKEVLLEYVEPYLRTDPNFYTVVQNNDIIKGKRYKESLSTLYGKITIFENFAGFKIIDERNGNMIDEIRAQSARRHNAHAFWFIFDNVSLFSISDFVSGLGGLEHILRIGSIFIIPSDRHDTATFSNSQSLPQIYLYESVPGGIGIADKAFRIWKDIIQEGIKIADRCLCKDGCPRCIHPPRLKSTIGISKISGIELAYQLLEHAQSEPDEEYDPGIHGWVKTI